jgi:formate hydrogenlyase subunit 3/multisubunit Na+/H+ antiporter MnhD subunit
MNNVKKKMPRFRFMAMSKLIGLIAIGFVFIVTIYTMQEMHNTGNYDALPQLIISAFGFATIYAGFYLTMAKVEHVEEEKTRREKELILLQKKNTPQEAIDDKRQEIENLRQKMSDIISETQNLFN